jgi:hypothetical protein
MRWHFPLLAASLVLSAPLYAGLKKGEKASLTGAEVKKILSLPFFKTTFLDKESGRTFSCVPTLDAKDFSRLYFGGRSIEDDEIFHLSSDASETSYFFKVKQGGPIFLGSHTHFIDGSYDKYVFTLHEERLAAGATEETKAASGGAGASGSDLADLLNVDLSGASLEDVTFSGGGEASSS